MKKPNALQAALSKSASPAPALDLARPAKIAAMQTAINEGMESGVSDKSVPDIRADARRAVASSRDGLVNVSSWQPPQFKQNLLLLKAYGKGDVQTLMAEALNDLFEKHNLPVVKGD